MFNSFFTACDVCAEVLEGKKGTAEIHKDYLTIKGNILFTIWDGKENDYKTYWAKRRDDTSDLHFCNAQCLSDYMTGKKVLVDQIKQSRQDESMFL